MKRLLLATLIALTAAPALPVLAREAPHCERTDRRGDRQDQRRDCPPPARHDQRAERPMGPQADQRPRAHGERRDVRRNDEHRPDWRPGQTYRGHGARVDHRRVDLPAPPRGQHWIRDGERYLLVSDRSGVIRHVMARALH